MTIEIGVLVGVCSLLLASGAFFVGRISAAKNDGEWKGKLDATLEHIQKDLGEIKVTIAKNADHNRDSLRRVHERIDAHLRDDHGITAPSRNDN